MAIRKIAGIQYLNARLMVAVKRSGVRWTISVTCIGRIGEPDSHMVNLDGTSGRIEGRVVREHRRRRSDAWGLDEGLFAENASEISDASAVAVSENVSLVPSQAEWTFWHLEEESCELCFWRQVEHLDVHVLNQSKSLIVTRPDALVARQAAAPADTFKLKVMLSPAAALARGAMPVKPATAARATASKMVFIDAPFCLLVVG